MPLSGPVRAVSFDCYGTLIDRDRGIRGYVAPLLSRKMPSRADQAQAEARPVVTPDEWLAVWLKEERATIASMRPARSYGEVLALSFAATMRRVQLEAFVDEGFGLIRAVAEWTPFADARALRKIGRGRQLAIVANADREMLGATLAHLQAPFSSVVTVEDAGAFKPDPAPLAVAVERLAIPPGEILHVAASWSQDLVPARALGMRTALLRRAPPEPGEEPDLTLPSLEALADALSS